VRVGLNRACPACHCPAISTWFAISIAEPAEGGPMHPGGLGEPEIGTVSTTGDARQQSAN
jgi:hypothetical protein